MTRSKNPWAFFNLIESIIEVPWGFSVDGEEEFFFGLATAPAHVEDRLDDAWLQFAEEQPCDKSETQQGSEPSHALIGSAGDDGGPHLAPSSSKAANETMKKKKTLKIAMEAMIRGFEKFEEQSSDECHHNVAAWHNVPHP